MKIHPKTVLKNKIHPNISEGVGWGVFIGISRYLEKRASPWGGATYNPL